MKSKAEAGHNVNMPFIAADGTPVRGEERHRGASRSSDQGDMIHDHCLNFTGIV